MNHLETENFNLDCRGRLSFLEKCVLYRQFQFEKYFSHHFPEDNCIPQGSTLSPDLFYPETNNIIKSVSSNANTSLFVDNVAV